MYNLSTGDPIGPNVNINMNNEIVTCLLDQSTTNTNRYIYTIQTLQTQHKDK